MNAPLELHKRLLKLYPVKIVKDHFEPEGATQAEMIPEIVNNNNLNTIKQFALDNHNYSKQHIYFFKLNRNFVRRDFNLNNLDLPLEEEIIIEGGYNFKFLPQIDYNVVLGNPTEESTLKFYQPVMVRVKDSILTISTTIMEKNLEYYYGNRKVYEANKAHGEDYLIKLISQHFETFYDVSPLDLNRGIKQLWEDDLIDSKYVRWKKSHSTTTEQMDEEYTLKQKYPDIYNQLIQSPLNRTIFKNITDNEDICSHFTIDPSKGFLTISIYPDNLEQTSNVINKILVNN